MSRGEVRYRGNVGRREVVAEGKIERQGGEEGRVMKEREHEKTGISWECS